MPNNRTPVTPGTAASCAQGRGGCPGIAGVHDAHADEPVGCGGHGVDHVAVVSAVRTVRLHQNGALHTPFRAVAAYSSALTGCSRNHWLPTPDGRNG